MIEEEIYNTINSMYNWFNQIADPKKAFSKKDLEKYFTHDFVMQLNDEIETNDYNSLFDHFEDFRSSGNKLEVKMPLDEVILSDDMGKVVARYNINKITPNNEIYNIKVIAIWHISDDMRLSRMNEVVYFDKTNE